METRNDIGSNKVYSISENWIIRPADFHARKVGCGDDIDDTLALISACVGR